MGEWRVPTNKFIKATKEVSVDSVLTKMELILWAIKGLKGEYNCGKPLGCLADTLVEAMEELEMLAGIKK
ncbi:MAG: hypothetical protein MCM46_06190 [Candidatus Manganitrophus sp. SB1]|nr:hypothetical protein [Candidatus Manganitrophus morganii]